MKTRANLDIRYEVKASGLYLWEVCELYGCAEAAFCRKLRHELSQADKGKIRNIIRELSKN